jgi:hypothetical protein
MTRILKAGYPDMVIELMKDSAYKFDKKWVFQHIKDLIKQKEEHEYIRENNEYFFLIQKYFKKYNRS